MRKIVLTGPAADRFGKFRDAGETLTAGSAATLDLVDEVADALLDQGRAVLLAQVPMKSSNPKKVSGRDPLDHDGDGRRGGSAPAKD